MTTPPARIRALDHLVLTVADPEASAAFYTRVLGVERQDFIAADGSRRLALCFGGQKINLHPASAPFAPHAARPMPGSGDLCFLATGEIGEWEAHLRACGLDVAAGPVPRTGATGPVCSVYCRDPDGNLVEIAVPAAPE